MKLGNNNKLYTTKWRLAPLTVKQNYGWHIKAWFHRHGLN